MCSSCPIFGCGCCTRLEYADLRPQWSFNAGLFSLFEMGLGAYARPAAIEIAGLLLLRAVRVHTDPARIALWAAGLFVLFSPTVHPWYVLWAWVPALLCGVRSWTVLATLVPLSYALASYDPITSSWEDLVAAAGLDAALLGGTDMGVRAAQHPAGALGRWTRLDSPAIHPGRNPTPRPCFRADCAG